MKSITALENQISALRAQLIGCRNADMKEDLEDRIDAIEDQISDLVNDVDPEDVYGILGRADSPSLNTSLNY